MFHLDRCTIFIYLSNLTHCILWLVLCIYFHSINWCIMLFLYSSCSIFFIRDFQSYKEFGDFWFILPKYWKGIFYSLKVLKNSPSKPQFLYRYGTWVEEAGSVCWAMLQFIKWFFIGPSWNSAHSIVNSAHSIVNSGILEFPIKFPSHHKY
jgi:hypothetical protein